MYSIQNLGGKSEKMKKAVLLLSALVLTVGLLLTVVSVTATCGDCDGCDGVCQYDCDGDGDCGCDGTQKRSGKNW
jgi:hypothetical protein